MPSSRLKTGYIALFIGLFLLSMWIAVNRIYQVDEAQNVYEAWLMASGKAGRYDMYAPIYLFGLKHVVGFGDSAESMYLLSRLCWVPVFWGILIFIARSAASSWTGAAFWKALLMAAFTAPLWTYGLEIRHDGPALVLMLAAWCLMNPRRAFRPWAHAMVGLCLALIYFCSAKHILYMIPIVALSVMVQHPLHEGSRLRKVAEICLGLFTGFALFIALHAMNGSLHHVVQEYRAFYTGVGKVDRFGPWVLLGNLIEQCPLALSVAVFPFLLVPRRGIRELFSASWTNGISGLVFLGSVLVGILANPVPFPYNSLPLIAVGLAVGLKPLFAWEETQPRDSAARSLSSALLVCALVLPWGIQVSRLLDADNYRQVELMGLAERFSGTGGRVFDAAGLVPGRESIEPSWFIHLGNAQTFHDNPSRNLEKLIRAHPPAVLIPTYRMNYLDDEAQGFIRRNYVPLAADFCVLGQNFTNPQANWDCLLPGRYWVQVAPGAVCSMDGRALATGALEVAAGVHALTASAGGVSIAWLGPDLQAPPRMRESTTGVFPVPIQM